MKLFWEDNQSIYIPQELVFVIIQRLFDTASILLQNHLLFMIKYVMMKVKVQVSLFFLVAKDSEITKTI